MKIKIFKKFFTKCFTSSISKKDIIRKNDSGTSTVFKHQHHVLQKVQLVVACCNNQIITHCCNINASCRTGTKRWICKNYIYKMFRLMLKTVFTFNWSCISSDVVKVKIHRSKCYYKRCDIISA